MPEIITAKLAIGISACAYDCPVRYNGKRFDALKVMGRERADFAWTPVCPECLAGLGVPRMPIHLTGDGAEVLSGNAKVLDRRGRDVTDDVVAGAQAAFDALKRAGCVAFVAREASPSCGLYKAQVGRRRTTAGGAGVLGAMLHTSGMFLIPDEGLSHALSWWDWRRRLHAWIWLRDREIAGSGDLYDAWHTVKFILQETDRPAADELGRSLAALPKHPAPEQLDALKVAMLRALTKPSSKPRIRAALFKTVAHLRKKGQLEGVDLHGLEAGSPEERASVDEVARQLIVAERVSFENDLLFGTSPVIRRDGRRVAAHEHERDGAADTTESE